MIAHDHGHHAHDHGHDHKHDHAHADHSHEDHDHGSAPWRYVVMLVPVILFLLGLPNKGPSVGRLHGDARDGGARNYRRSATSVSDADTDADPVEFKRLFDSPATSESRFDNADHVVKFRGQITVNPTDPRFFQIVRFRGACCAADAQPLPILCVSKQPITEFKRDAWVEVRGKVQYAQVADSSPPTFRLRVLVSSADKVASCPPDPNPYIK